MIEILKAEPVLVIALYLQLLVVIVVMAAMVRTAAAVERIDKLLSEQVEKSDNKK